MLRIAALATAAFAVATTAASSAAQTARLRLLDTEPVVLRGTGFAPREHLRITVVSTARIVRRVTASSGGTFGMRLQSLDLEGCAGFSILATGDEGSRATFKRVPGVCPVR